MSQSFVPRNLAQGKKLNDRNINLQETKANRLKIDNDLLNSNKYGIPSFKKENEFFGTEDLPSTPFYNGIADISSSVPGEQRIRTLALYDQGSGKAYGQERLTNVLQPREATGSLGSVYLGNEFFDFLQKKKELEFYEDYELFKMSLIDTKNLETREWWKKHHPQLWEKKMKYFMDYLEIMKKCNEIFLRGAESEEDFRWLYLYYLNNKGTPTRFLNEQDSTNFPIRPPFEDSLNIQKVGGEGDDKDKYKRILG